MLKLKHLNSIFFFAGFTAEVTGAAKLPGGSPGLAGMGLAGMPSGSFEFGGGFPSSSST